MTVEGYMITVVCAIFGSVGFWTFIQHVIDKRSYTRQILMGITYLGIVKSAEAILDRGWVDLDELGYLQKYLYEPYKKMGGNGTAELLMKKVEALPNHPPKEAEKHEQESFRMGEHWRERQGDRRKAR